MIIFDQLRISDDGKSLLINLHVNTADPFASIYLKKLTIMTADKVMEATYTTPTSDYVYQYTFQEDVKEAAFVLTVADFNAAYINNNEGEPLDPTKPIAQVNFSNTDFSHDLFFVYVECKHSGAIDSCFECLPCSLQEMTTVGVTFDENLLYQKVMDFTKQLASDCTIPQGFTDFILLWDAFKASVETEHFVPAKKYYNMLFGNGSGFSGNTGTTSRCGCHG